MTSQAEHNAAAAAEKVEQGYIIDGCRDGIPFAPVSCTASSVWYSCNGFHIVLVTSEGPSIQLRLNIGAGAPTALFCVT